MGISTSETHNRLSYRSRFQSCIILIDMFVMFSPWVMLSSDDAQKYDAGSSAIVIEMVAGIMLAFGLCSISIGQVLLMWWAFRSSVDAQMLTCSCLTFSIGALRIRLLAMGVGVCVWLGAQFAPISSTASTFIFLVLYDIYSLATLYDYFNAYRNS